MSGRPGSQVRASTWVVTDGVANGREDRLATEEPLEIRLSAGGSVETVAVTMRTPGNDFELAAGFLFNEGVLGARGEVRRIAYCVDRELDEEQRYNIVTVELSRDALPELDRLERHFLTTSACGVCGKAGLDALELRGCEPLAAGPQVRADVLYTLPDQLREHQRIFSATGGLHAAALFDASGALLQVREDVGRHNALDKLIGWAFLEGRLPLGEHVVLVSGRSSYEIVQKALAAGVPMVCSVSAPSSLAVALAERFGMTLIGFLRDRRFNVYAGLERVLVSPALAAGASRPAVDGGGLS